MFETSDNTSKIFTVLFLLTAFTIGLTTNSLAYTPTHPLSDITPMDVPLALDGQPIQAGDGQYVVIEDELVVQSDLDMSDQDIENVGNLTAFFTESCPDGELVKGVEDDGEVVCGSAEGEVDDIFVHRTGDQMEGDLDFDGQNILRAGDITVENDGGTHISVLEESEYPSTVQFQAADDEWQVGTRGEDEFYIGMGNTGSSRSGLMDSSVLTASETGVGVSGVGERFSPSYRLDVSGDARISSGLDMAGSSISGINELQNYFGDSCGEGYVALGVDDDGEIVCGDIEGMADEEFVHQEGDYMTGDLDMRGNNILDVGSLVLDDGGSVDSLSGGSVGLSADGEQSVYLDGGNQYVGVGTSSPSHELDVVGSGRFSLDLNVGGDLDMETGDISNINELSGFFGDACGEGSYAKGVNDDGSIVCEDIEDEVDDEFVHQTGDYMTGDLDMRGNNILDVGTLNTEDVSASGDVLAEGRVVASAEEDQITLAHNNDPSNERWKMRYTDDYDDWSFILEDVTNDVPRFGVGRQSNTDRSFINPEQGNFGVGTRSPSSTLDVSGDARISSGLDMAGSSISGINELQNYFGDACGEGSYAKGVDDDGDIVCDPFDEGDIDDHFVHQEGDYMTGDLDMRGNNILDVGGMSLEHSVDINTPTDAGRLLGIYGYGDTHELGIHYQTYGSNVYEFDTTEDRDIAFMPDSDRIGINTASPDYELDVDGTVYAGNGIVVGGSDSHSYQGIRSEDDHLMFDAPSGSNTYVNWDSGDGFYVGGSDVELADDNQPVGVGTGRSPDSQLHVGGDTKVDGDIEINDGQASGTNKVKGDRELYAADETEISGGTKELTLVFNEDYGHSPSHVNVIARVDGSISITIDGNEETLSGENEIDEATWDTSDWGDGTYDVYVDIPAGDMNDVIEFYYVH